MKKIEENTFLAAEWEPVEAVMVAVPPESPDSDWYYIYDDIIAQYRLLVETFVTNGITVLLLCHDKEISARFEGIDQTLIRYIECPFNDTWVRDYGPLAIHEFYDWKLLDFGFNGWGLKFAADKDNLVNLRLNEMKIIDKSVYKNCRDFILEGGSIESDGNGTILTTSRCLCSPNRNGGKSQNEITKILAKKLNARRILWLENGGLEGDDTDSHIDTLARLCPENTIIFTGCKNPDDPHFEPLLKMKRELMMMCDSEGQLYNLIELPLPSPIYDPLDGHRLPATYANYLIVNDKIFMPTYGQPDNDRLAAWIISVAFPDHKIVPVDCRTFIRQHGSLHCATMQIHKGSLNLSKIPK